MHGMWPGTFILFYGWCDCLQFHAFLHVSFLAPITISFIPPSARQAGRQTGGGLIFAPFACPGGGSLLLSMSPSQHSSMLCLPALYRRRRGGGRRLAPLPVPLCHACCTLQKENASHVPLPLGRRDISGRGGMGRHRHLVATWAT